MAKMDYFYKSRSMRMKPVLEIAYENVVSHKLSAFWRYKWVANGAAPSIHANQKFSLSPAGYIDI